MYEMPCRIRFSEADRSGRLSMNGLLRLFQDCGYNHAVDRHFGLEYTGRTHCTWYLLSWKIQAVNMPMVGEETVIRTCIYDMQASIAKKSIAMYSHDGKCLAVGDTMWVYMDVTKQEPKEPGPGGWLPEDFGEEIAVPSSAMSSRRIIIPEGGSSLAPHMVNPYLIDTNGHANNVRLTELAMNLCGADDGSCNMLRAEFKRQVKADSVIYPYVWKDNKITIVSFRDEEGLNLAAFSFFAESSI